MKEEQIHYNYYFWGPLLFKATVNDVDLKKLKKICKKRKDWDYRHNLAGVIDNEYEIDRKEFINIVNRYISAYAQAFKLYYGKEMPGVLNIDSAWVNYMKKGESNPMHIHFPCDLSSVLYLDVPDELLEEQRQFTGKGGGPGSISFFNQCPAPGFVGQQVFKPKTGDFFIFPAMLCHSVATFKSDIERVSIAANFSFRVVDENNKPTNVSPDGWQVRQKDVWGG
jgi:hypothetical protein